jgi:arylsulfatase A-like enzyme
MKKLSYLCFLLILTGLFSSCKSTVKKSKLEATKQEKLNVLFIAVDDLNTWIGCLNNYSNTKTPNLDKLAATGVLFSNAHENAPLCGPSRTSIMTGLRQSTIGMYGMTTDD